MFRNIVLYRFARVLVADWKKYFNHSEVCSGVQLLQTSQRLNLYYTSVYARENVQIQSCTNKFQSYWNINFFFFLTTATGKHVPGKPIYIFVHVHVGAYLQICYIYM